MKRLSNTIILLLIILTSCRESNKVNQNNIVTTNIEQTSLRFDWIPSMSFCGDIVAQFDYAPKNNISIKLESASEGIDPIKMVIAGTNDFGIVSAERILMANEKGADLVAIGIINNVSPAVFLSKKSKNITSPKDFEGKRVGIQSGGATEYVYRALVKKTGIQQSKVKEVAIGFDMKSFISGDNFDVRPGFIYDETLSLEEAGVEYNVVEPKKFGLYFPGRVYFTSRKLINENPQKVQNFINTVAEGWTDVLKNPEKGIKYLVKFDNSVKEERERKGLYKGLEYFRGFNDKILMADTIAWQTMIDDLNVLGVIKSDNLANCLDLKFVEKYHSSNKK
jgi:NitT/TauT family transport system substrate-binding protein